VIGKTLDYLRAGRTRTEALQLGCFGSASVILQWDNEDFPRCFLIVGPNARAVLRVSLFSEDIAMLAEALEQVVEDLPAIA
jgi:hypothetical protein